MTLEREAIRRRIVEAGWLEVEAGERGLLHVRLGSRFTVKGDE